MIGPALAGLLIAKVGTGWAFLINGISFAAVLISMSVFRVSELQPSVRAGRAPGGFMEGFRYVWGRADLRAIMVMLFLIGTFGLNFPIFISTMAVKVFHADAQGFGLLSSIMAVGTISGALLAAGRDKPQFGSLLIGAAVFGIGCTLAALSPGYWWFAGSLVLIGVAALTLTKHNEQLDAAFHGARHAGASHGASFSGCTRRYPDRRTHCRLGRESFRPALGARSGCRIGVCRCHRGYSGSDATGTIHTRKARDL